MTRQKRLQLSPEWNALRRRLITDRQFACEDCGEENESFGMFHLHHKYYESGRKDWEYPDNCFKVLCVPCHEHTTQALNSMLYTLGHFDAAKIVEISNSIQEAITEGNSPNLISTLIMALLADTRKVHIVIGDVAEVVK